MEVNWYVDRCIIFSETKQLPPSKIWGDIVDCIESSCRKFVVLDEETKTRHEERTWSIYIAINIASNQRFIKENHFILCCHPSNYNLEIVLVFARRLCGLRWRFDGFVECFFIVTFWVNIVVREINLKCIWFDNFNEICNAMYNISFVRQNS